MAFFFSVTAFAQDSWQMVGGRIASPWSEQVNPENPLPEYPRPQMVRENNWQSLNGLWDYAIVKNTQEDKVPKEYQGKILVPYPLESALSGVGKTLGKDSVLWYYKKISIPSHMKGQKLLLHFGAVDWACDVYLNGRKAGSHRGGYDPFSFDISPFLKRGTVQELAVKVADPTDEGPQPRGKQVRKPHAIWYTPVTGIWQTVWMEAVPDAYIITTRQTPDVDAQLLEISLTVGGFKSGDQIKVVALDGEKKVSEKVFTSLDNLKLEIRDAILWSPSNPHLYDLHISLVRNSKVIDEIKSYFAMRKISVKPDRNGVLRMMLNNQFVFQYGPLDQGWWPDGLYTAPTDEALLFDIKKTKEMGFNMIRKHVKVEPARWYYHCDRMGMLVWQDMPNGDWGGRWNHILGIDGIAEEMVRTDESEKIFRTEWAAIMKSLHNFPSIVVWVPFNEAWGQFKTAEITEWTMNMDPSRLVNSASGGNFYPVGHILDIHNYPDPAMPQSDIYGKRQVLVLGEYGGLGLPVEGHTWQEKENWGYQNFVNKEELIKRYESYIDRLEKLIAKGLSAAVYTQTTDVEIEVNGLMTYDRKVIKMPEHRLKQVHQKLYNSLLAGIE